MQALGGTARAQHPGIGGHLGQAIGQGDAKGIIRGHFAMDMGGARLDRLGGVGERRERE